MTDGATATTGPHAEEEPSLPEEPAPRPRIRTAATQMVVGHGAGGRRHLRRRWP